MISILGENTFQIAGETVKYDDVANIDVSCEPVLDFDATREWSKAVPGIECYKPGPETVHRVTLKNGRVLTETRVNKEYK